MTVREVKRHGTSTSYGYGCRCADCTAAETARRAAYRARVRAGTQVPFQPAPHGSTSKYGAGCRCDPCREGNAAAYKSRSPRQRRAIGLRYLYGMTLDQWDELVISQSGRCAACGDELRGDRNKGVHVDHDHATGEVRGLLCFHCNVAEGHLKGDPDRALRLAVYLLTKTDVLTTATLLR